MPDLDGINGINGIISKLTKEKHQSSFRKFRLKVP